MNIHNSNLHREQPSVDAVEARLAWHKKVLGITLTLVIGMAAVTLALLAANIP